MQTYYYALSKTLVPLLILSCLSLWFLFFALSFVGFPVEGDGAGVQRPHGECCMCTNLTRASHIARKQNRCTHSWSGRYFPTSRSWRWTSLMGGEDWALFLNLNQSGAWTIEVLVVNIPFPDWNVRKNVVVVGSCIGTQCDSWVPNF